MCKTLHDFTNTGLSCVQFSILNVLESLVLKDQKKYNNTEMKSGDFFTATTRCCEYKNSGKKLIPQEQPNQNKEKKIANNTRAFGTGTPYPFP